MDAKEAFTVMEQVRKGRSITEEQTKKLEKLDVPE
jgi:DNA polymerase III alpha subunit (gram-positive type)